MSLCKRYHQNRANPTEQTSRFQNSKQRHMIEIPSSSQRFGNYNALLQFRINHRPHSLPSAWSCHHAFQQFPRETIKAGLNPQHKPHRTTTPSNKSPLAPKLLATTIHNRLQSRVLAFLYSCHYASQHFPKRITRTGPTAQTSWDQNAKQQIGTWPKLPAAPDLFAITMFWCNSG